MPGLVVMPILVRVTQRRYRAAARKREANCRRTRFGASVCSSLRKQAKEWVPAGWKLRGAFEQTVASVRGVDAWPSTGHNSGSMDDLLATLLDLSGRSLDRVHDDIAILAVRNLA